MVTREDLEVIETQQDETSHRDVVKYGDKCYIVATYDNREDFLAALFGAKDYESFVMEAKYDTGYGEYIPANECGPQCEQGVCNKRLATRESDSDASVYDIDVAYGLLLTALNA